MSQTWQSTFFYADIIYLGIVGLYFYRIGGGKEEGRGNLRRKKYKNEIFKIIY